MKKDCLIISMFPKDETVFAQYYIKQLEENNKTFDIIYFERYDMDAVAAENEILFKRYCPTGGKKSSKLLIMAQYARFIRNHLKSGNYSSAIILTTVPGVMCADILKRRFSGKYIFDIRDYTHESNSIYYKTVESLINHSAFTTISSKGFLSFLPESEKYKLVHNINIDYVKKDHYQTPDSGITTIGFVGSVRYYNENAELIRQFANCNNYQLVYYGNITNDCDLPGYCQKNSISNVSFKGHFNNSKKDEIYQTINIINSIYGLSSGLETKTAMPNRFYDAAIYKIPILVSKDTFLEKEVAHYKIGFAVDIFKDDVKDLLEAYLKDFNQEEFEAGCDRLLSDVNNDMEDFKTAIIHFVSEI